MDDLISRQSVLNILLYFNAPRQLEMIKKLPPAQTDLITKMQNGIIATDADDVYSCGMRNGMRWCISLIDGKEPLYENCPSAQPEIVRCKDCKYRDENWRRVSVRWLPCMDVRTGNNWYCGSAERQEEDE